ncbi:MAG: transposase [Opitutales bacterium]
MPPPRIRRTEDLRLGRTSTPGARYFVTWCTHARRPSLTCQRVLPKVKEAIVDLHGSDIELLAATIMPDHIHLLFRLGSRLTLSQVAGKAKAAIHRRDSNLAWQENYFDRQLRENETADGFAFYVFMNPYCASLIDLNSTWAGWISSPTVRWKFEDSLRLGNLPQPEWLEQAAGFGRDLPDGAE